MLRPHHDLGRLIAAGVPTSVQTTVVSGGSWVVDWAASFCLARGVRRLGIMPFIPRGSGLERRGDFALSARERSSLRELVSLKRRELSGRLELRWLDFTASSLAVLEADGRVIQEGASESMDRVICNVADLPGGAHGSGK